MTKSASKTSQNKTAPTAASVSGFINAVENDTRRADAKVLLAMMKRVTGQKPKMWGPSIIGFGEYHYKYDSGREGDFLRTGFSPRKANLVVYVMPGFKAYGPLLKRLGKYKTGSSCLYVNKLADVDLEVLEELIAKGYAHMNEKYPG
ncbi:MAG: DUF1801 domain-containing protein [Maricaulaceae bacterium]|jgi:hypothetical protein